MESRISKVINYRYCQLDGKECTKCKKCNYMPKQKSNLASKLVIILLIILLFYILFFQTIPMAIELYHLDKDTVNNLTTSDDTTQNYDIYMSDEEREYRNHTGLGVESIGENYNPMK